MNFNIVIRALKRLILLLPVMLVVLVSSTYAADVYLVAKEFDKTMADGSVVNMWGFALSDAGFTTVGSPTVPGPMITVPVGDNSLNIYLRNDLADESVSIIIPGQAANLSPVYFTDSKGRQRLESFTTKTAPGTIETYSWSNLKPGTYIYQSGTHPALQAPMGLYGAVIHDAASGTAYNDNPNIDASYDKEIVLFYSEIDPALHQAVNNGTYGTAAYPSTIDYAPKYFLINGESYPYVDGLPADLYMGQRVLIRFLSAALNDHVPVLQGNYMSIIAENGNLYPYVKEQYSVLLSAGKTIDAIWNPSSPGIYPVYDRRLQLTNNGEPEGGMLAYLEVGPVAKDDGYSIDEDNVLIITDPGIASGNNLGVLSNDTGVGALSGVLFNDVSHGQLSLISDGTFSYRPDADFHGTDFFAYKINDDNHTSNLAVAKITVNSVNDLPVAAADFASTPKSDPVIIDVIANDYDPDGSIDPASIQIIRRPSGLAGRVVVNDNGTITFIPRRSRRWRDSAYFTYNVRDNEAGVSNTVRVTVQITQDSSGGRGTGRDGRFRR